MSRRIRYARFSPRATGWFRRIIDDYAPRTPLVAIEVDYDADREDILRALGDMAAAVIEDRELRHNVSGGLSE